MVPLENVYGLVGPYSANHKENTEIPVLLIRRYVVDNKWVIRQVLKLNKAMQLIMSRRIQGIGYHFIKSDRVRFNLQLCLDRKFSKD